MYVLIFIFHQQTTQFSNMVYLVSNFSLMHSSVVNLVDNKCNGNICLRIFKVSLPISPLLIVNYRRCS